MLSRHGLFGRESARLHAVLALNCKPILPKLPSLSAARGQLDSHSSFLPRQAHFPAAQHARPSTQQIGSFAWTRMGRPLLAGLRCREVVIIKYHLMQLEAVRLEAVLEATRIR